MKYTKQWLKATVIRVVKTAAETLLGFCAVGVAINDVDWMLALSVTGVASLAAFLTCLKGLPEVKLPEVTE